jgi:hypothetical protein
MDYSKSGVICTKNKLWKHKNLVLGIIYKLQEHGYGFNEVVIGEPNNFIFAESLDEVDELFTKKGFYGIRIKMSNDHVMIEINSNTDGVDNVQYTVFAETTGLLDVAIDHVMDTAYIIKPSNEQMASFSEWVDHHRQLRNIVIFILIGIVLYILGVHVLLLSLVTYAFSFSPFLVIFVIYLIYSRNRR